MQHSFLPPCSPGPWKHVVPSAVLSDNIPLIRSLLLTQKCPQVLLLLCTSCPLVFAASPPCLSGHYKMCPLDTCSLPLALPVTACLERSQELLEERLRENNKKVGLGCAKLECRTVGTTLGEDLEGGQQHGACSCWHPIAIASCGVQPP